MAGSINITGGATQTQPSTSPDNIVDTLAKSADTVDVKQGKNGKEISITKKGITCSYPFVEYTGIEGTKDYMAAIADNKKRATGLEFHKFQKPDGNIVKGFFHPTDAALIGNDMKGIKTTSPDLAAYKALTQVMHKHTASSVWNHNGAPKPVGMTGTKHATKK